MSRPLPDTVQGRFDAIGERIMACEVVRDFPWSQVLRLTTADGGTRWVKRCGDGMAFEPALTAVVERVGSPLLVPSLWIDGRWIATEHVDGQLGRGDLGILDALLRIQAPLAELQAGLVPLLDHAVAAGTPSLGSTDAEALIERALGLCARDAHMADRPLAPAEVEGVRAAGPRLRSMLAALESATDVRTIQHLDLHHGNVFDAPDGVRIFDWGDARIGTPLLHVVSTVSLTAFVADVNSRDPRITEIVDAYLAGWPDLAVDRATWDVIHDPRLAAFLRLDALAAALFDGEDEQLRPFVDWTVELVRAAASPRPTGATGVRLA
ncbi:MAG: hypothetical protein JWM98_971 [Thermoleophilia bacterium]|nr:hypothetical protein [Thermoleophilia bacterium]